MRASSHEHTAKPRRRASDLDRGILARTRAVMRHVSAEIPGVGSVATQGQTLTLQINHRFHRADGGPQTYVYLHVNGHTCAENTLTADPATGTLTIVTDKGWRFDVSLDAWQRLYAKACANAAALGIAPFTEYDLGIAVRDGGQVVPAAVDARVARVTQHLLDGSPFADPAKAEAYARQLLAYVGTLLPPTGETL